MNDRLNGCHVRPRHGNGVRSLLIAAAFGWAAQEAQGQSPFASMMELATASSVIEVDTVAGKTRVLLASGEDAPRVLVVFAPGGQGGVDFSADAAGRPVSARPRNPAFMFAPEFLKRRAAWAILAVPESFGAEISETQRLDGKHIEAVAQVAQRLRAAHPTARLVLIGHSNGGITAAMQAIQTKPAFDAIVLSAPNLRWLPFRWQAQTRVPVLFITHKSDECPSTAAWKTVSAAGDRHPVVVIERPSPGPRAECFATPAPHFFSDAYGEYAEAILRWAATL